MLERVDGSTGAGSLYYGVRAAVLALALLAAGCKQGAGERCQIASDCADGLICDTGGKSAIIGGVCREPSAVGDLSMQMSPDLADGG